MKPRRNKLNTLWLWVRRFSRQIQRDNITVYAAQASFFVVISVVPFLSLLISIISFFIPADIQGIFDGSAIPGELENAIGSLLHDLQTAPKVSLLSLSAVTALWTSSKGTSAIRTGIKTIYRARSTDNYLLQRFKSLVYTLIFILLILATTALLLFGEFILELLDISLLTKLVMHLRFPLIVLFMIIVFTAMYVSAARRSRRVRDSILQNLPGAILATVGWILFSWLYSLYIKYFPSASYIYGSLTAVCLIMLWLYFCMIILLLGAEVNKLFFAKKQRIRQEKPASSVSPSTEIP